MPNLILLGPSGAGKSSCAKILAEQTKLSLVDSDKLIAEGTGMSPQQIFATMGEATFRELENQLLDSLFEETAAFVLACGGGLPIFPGNIEKLNRLGLTVYLKAGPQALAKRVLASEARPMLDGEGDLVNRVSQLLAKRAPVYEKAQFTVDTTGMTVEETVQTILNYLK